MKMSDKARFLRKTDFYTATVPRNGPQVTRW